MFCRSLLLLFAISHLSLRANWEENSVRVKVHFINDNTVDATLIGYEGDALTFLPRWTHVPSTAGFRFLEGISFHRTPSHEAPPPRATLHLTNGDRLEGELTGVSPQWLEWKSPWGQSLRVRRDMVGRVDFPPPESMLLDHGVIPPSLWSLMAPGGNRLEPEPVAGALMLPQGVSATLTRTLPQLPERFFLEFSMATRGVPFNYQMNLLGTHDAVRSPGILILNANQMHLFVREIEANGRMRQIVRVDLDREGPHRTRFRVYVDTGKRKGWFAMEGQERVGWDLAEHITPGAEGVVFTLRVQQSQTPFFLESYKMARWDGSFPNQQAAPVRPALDSIVLHDNTVIQGRLEGSRENVVLLSVDNGEAREISLDSVSSIQPAVNGRRQPRLRGRNVEIRFPDLPGRLTLALRAIEADALHGAGDAWEEELRVPLNALDSIRFNLVHHQTARAGGEK